MTPRAASFDSRRPMRRVSFCWYAFASSFAVFQGDVRTHSQTNRSRSGKRGTIAIAAARLVSGSVLRTNVGQSGIVVGSITNRARPCRGERVRRRKKKGKGTAAAIRVAASFRGGALARQQTRSRPPCNPAAD